jgi:2-methylisocitrate lyase-like PEP mutase family enzyme
MSTQTEKGEAFAALHARAGAFIIPNPWDAGSARLLAHLGFEALATTSAGYAFSLGRCDGAISRDETLGHMAAIAAATQLPVSGDLEDGFGESPEVVADTIARAAHAGLAGGSIEDRAGGGSGGIYELAHAVDRIRAAADAVRRLPFLFTLTARAENYLTGRPDLSDTIARLQAYQDAGADVLYAPGLRTQQEIETVVRAVDRPVNVVMGLQGAQLPVVELARIGVKRISIGSALARGAYGALLRAGREMRERGTFEFGHDAVSYREISALFASDAGANVR